MKEWEGWQDDPLGRAPMTEAIEETEKLQRRIAKLEAAVEDFKGRLKPAYDYVDGMAVSVAEDEIDRLQRRIAEIMAERDSARIERNEYFFERNKACARASELGIKLADFEAELFQTREKSSRLESRCQDLMDEIERLKELLKPNKEVAKLRAELKALR